VTRRALEELRQVLSVLQRTEESPDLAPRPGIEDIAELIENATAAGQPVAFTQGPVSNVPAAQGYVLYRVIQEALTNARRHAPGAPVDVEIAEHSGQIIVRIANQIPVSSNEPVVPGRGLIGMKERVEAIGGSLETGHRHRSFIISAELPLGGAETKSWRPGSSWPTTNRWSVLASRP
jgi:signal transduction histidine kinase